MNVLAIDTCFGACSVAVARPAGSGFDVSGRLERRDKGHAEALFPMIAAVLAEAGLAAAEISRIAVTEGPGSFTSVRIGLAAARGLALATGAETVVASSMHVMAIEAAQQLGAHIEPDSGFVVAMDARRDQVYAQCFDVAATPLGPVSLVDLAAVDAFLAQSWPDFSNSRDIVAVGAGAALVAAASDRYRCVVRIEDLVPDARRLAELAPRLMPVGAARPLYLRPPDARPQTAGLAPADPMPTPPTEPSS